MKHEDINRQNKNDAQSEKKEEEQGLGLPPRSEVHSRKKRRRKHPAEKREGKPRKFSFPLVRILFFTFLAMIISLIILFIWSEQNNGQLFGAVLGEMLALGDEISTCV